MPNNSSNKQCITLKPGQYGQFRPELSNAWRWFIHVIEETERKRNIPQIARYEMPIQERRRAS